MNAHAHPAPGIPYLTETAAQSLDRMSDRLQGEVTSHMRRAVHWAGQQEPTVQLSLEEARLMVGDLSRAAHLLRLTGECKA